MPTRFQTSSWSIEPVAGWVPDEPPDHVEIRAPTSDASLRLTNFADQSGQLDARRWVEFVAHISRLKKRHVEPAHCGVFGSYRVDFESNGRWFRSWALHAGTVGLDATYSCAVHDAGRDDADLDAMLDSLLCLTAAV